MINQQNRIKNLQKQLKYPVIIKKPENIFYLTGQKFIYGLLLVTKNQAILFGDGLEHVEKVKSDSITNLKKYIRTGSKLDVESELTLRELKLLEKFVPKLKVTPVGDLLDEFRAIKSTEEIKHIKEAVSLTHEVFQSVKKALKDDSWTERQLARLIRYEGIAIGAEDVSFDPIVASGPNSAIPHHKPSDKKIKVGEPVVLDFGFKVNGYCSDFTRTVFVKSASKEFAKLHGHVELAYKEAFEKITSGMKGKEIDALARQVLEKEKLSKFFIHSLGHGTGLEVHESPGVGPYSEDVLADGMVFSIEPGIYLKNKGGIRIEDLVYFEKGKPKQFGLVSTTLEKNIIN